MAEILGFFKGMLRTSFKGLIDRNRGLEKNFLGTLRKITEFLTFLSEHFQRPLTFLRKLIQEPVVKMLCIIKR